MYGTDLTGMRFGNLVVLERRRPPKGRCKWLCQCDCGNKIIVVGSKLQNGTRKTCGCYTNKIRDNVFTRKNNRYVFSPSGIEIYDDKGRMFIIDYDDFDIVKDYYWHINKNNYPYGTIRRNNKAYSIGVHRYLLDEYGDFLVDHIDGDKTNNKRSNLRIVTTTQNNQNSSLPSNNRSGVKGVFWYKPYEKWLSYITVNKKRIFLGYYSDFIDAVNARYNAVKQFFGNYANRDEIKMLEEMLRNGISYDTNVSN